MPTSEGRAVPGGTATEVRASLAAPVRRWVMLMAAVASAPVAVAAQIDPVDTVGAVQEAREAQARYERLRFRLLPTARGGLPSQPCDERIGRFCVWLDDADWYPRPEAPEVAASRGELLAFLDTLQRTAVTSGWILGQRVAYRLEDGRPDLALDAARRCGPAPWWCAALEGWALHEQGRFVEADQAFGTARSGMPAAWAREWTSPRELVSDRGVDLLEEAEPTERGATPDSLLASFWALSDPLWLVPGNDRRTAHFARHALSMVREGARTPFRVRWGDDLAEMLVRFGPELGWERPARVEPGVGATGRNHPQGRDWVPEPRVWTDPSSASTGDLTAPTVPARSTYAPAYAPVILPFEGQWAVFPRGDSVAVVATWILPEDTTAHGGWSPPRPWMEAGEQSGWPPRSGLHLARVGSWDDVMVAPSDRLSGAAVVRTSAGRFVASAEVWDPPSRRAGRSRRGIRADTVPADRPTLSDLLLVTPQTLPPPTLDAAVERALPSLRLRAGQAFGVVWEVAGIGFEEDEVRYRLSMDQDQGGFLRSAGRLLGLVGDPGRHRLEWKEAGWPSVPGRTLRHVTILQPPEQEGTYRLRLEAILPGRASLVRDLEVTLGKPEPTHR